MVSGDDDSTVTAGSGGDGNTGKAGYGGSSLNLSEGGQGEEGGAEDIPEAGPGCGDGKVNQPDEECDDGNTLPVTAAPARAPEKTTPCAHRRRTMHVHHQVRRRRDRSPPKLATTATTRMVMAAPQIAWSKIRCTTAPRSTRRASTRSSAATAKSPAMRFAMTRTNSLATAVRQTAEPSSPTSSVASRAKRRVTRSSFRCAATAHSMPVKTATTATPRARSMAVARRVKWTPLGSARRQAPDACRSAAATGCARRTSNATTATQSRATAAASKRAPAPAASKKASSARSKANRVSRSAATECSKATKSVTTATRRPVTVAAPLA